MKNALNKRRWLALLLAAVMLLPTLPAIEVHVHAEEANAGGIGTGESGTGTSGTDTGIGESGTGTGTTGTGATDTGTGESGASTAYGQVTGTCTICGGTYTNGFCSGETCIPYQTPAGSGTADDPYKIANAGNLYWFAAQANASDTKDDDENLVYAGCAVLTADIVVNPGTFAADGTYTPAGTETAIAWSPIGNYTGYVKYTGTFDGQGHSISGLYYDRNCEGSDGDDYAGLFGWVHSDGTVKNVTVQSSYFAATMFLGAIVGSNNGTVKNCHSRDNYLVGMGDDISCSECIGGVVGYNYGTLDQLSNIGGAVSGKENIGGVVGYSYGDILNCYNTAPVTGTYAVGGVVGYAECENIRFCYNIGTISCDNNAGSIVGHNENDDITFRGCYYQVAEGLAAIGNSTLSDGITPMTKEQFDSGDVVSQIVPEWQTYVDEFNGRLSSEELDKRLKENVWFMDPVTKLPAFDGDMVGHDGKIFGTRPSAGNGTAADPYQIDSYLDLNWFGGMLKGNHDYSLCAKLTADIVANPGTFDADGNYTPGKGEAEGTEAEGLNTVGAGNPYVGTFDGQGHTISGLYYGNDGTQGLFYCIGAGGTVKNVIIANSYFGNDETASLLGAIAAENYGTVENCGVLDSVYCKENGSTSGVAGGVVGTNYSTGTVKNCFSAASVAGSGDRGGVVGSNDGGAVTNCYYLQAEGLSGIGYDNTTGNTTTAVTDFSTGEVAYLLNGDQSAIVWYQTLGTDGDKYPVLDSTHGTVYLYGTTYANCPHNYENGICTICGGYRAPSKDENGVYLIASAANLYWFAQQVNSGSTSISGKLTADITVNENVHTNGVLSSGSDSFLQWTPIGDRDHAYTGSFDGQDHTISGLYYSNGTPSSNNTYYVGLFGYVEGGASIKNVGLIDSYFSMITVSTVTYFVRLGGIVARACNSATDGSSIEISGCYNEAVLCGKISWEGASVSVGGIVSEIYVSDLCTGNVEVKNCHNTGSVSGGSSASTAVGGIVSIINAKNNSVTVAGCYNTGSVSATSSTCTYVGGVIGYTHMYNKASVTVFDCYNTGELQGTGSTSNEVGGIVGNIEALYENSSNLFTVSNCYNAGGLSGTNCGGVAGAVYVVNKATITVNNCYFTNTGLSALQISTNGSISVDDNTTSVAAADVTSGKVTYLLNGGRTPSVWKQGDNGPAFEGHGIGYNSETKTYVLIHDFVGGVCKVCDLVCKHETTNEAGCATCGITYAAKLDLPLETKYYFTVADAFANAGNSATITLLKDAELTSTITIKNGYADITLIGGEHTLSANCRMFWLTRGTLTIKSGTYITTGGNVFYVTGDAGSSSSGTGTGSSSGTGSEGLITGTGTGKVDTSTEFTGTGTGDITVNPGAGTTTTESKSGTLKIEGGTFTSNSHTVYVARDNAASKDTTAVTTNIEKGKAEISGGVFTSTGGYAIYVGTETTGIASIGGELIVSGGEFNGGLSIITLAVFTTADVSVTLSGGTFDCISYGSKAEILKQYYAYFTKDEGGEYTVLTAAANVGTNAVQIKLCTHVYTKADGACDICGKACNHPTWSSATGACTICGYGHVHTDYDADGFCTVCRGGYQAPTQNSDGYYQIDNAGKLYWFAQQVNSGNTSINGKLTANIVVNENLLESLTYDADGNVTNGDSFRMWTPIGNNQYGYEGTFDGNQKTISGLYYNGSDRYVGLFGYVDSASIKNVGVIDNYFCISGGGTYVCLGGLVGSVCSSPDKTVTIENCYHSGTIIAKNTYGVKVGGLFGIIFSSTGCETITIKNCYNMGSINGKNTTKVASIGGLLGEVQYGSTGGPIVVENCYNSGAVSDQGAAEGADVGGLIGHAENPTTYVQSPLTLQNCYNMGMVDSTSGGACVGGLIGHAKADCEGVITIQTCYNAGSVSGASNVKCVGGLVGYILAEEERAKANILNCYNVGTVHTDESDNCLAKVGGMVGLAEADEGAIGIENGYNTGSISTSSKDAGTLIGYVSIVSPGKVSIQNVYSLTSSGAYEVGKEHKDITYTNVDSKSADEFASGAVAWLLNGETSDGVWKQTLGTDASPNFTGGTVYPVYKCDGSTISDSVYANSAGKKLPHVNMGIVCKNCGQLLIASVTVGETTDYYVTLSEAFAAASGKTATITLLDDTTLTSTIEIGDSNTNITLVGGECTVSAECAMFKITAGTLTIKSGKYTTTSGNVIEVSGTVTDSTTSSGSGTSSSESGLYTPSTDIGGVTIPTTTVGTVNIEGGSFTSASGYAVYVGIASGALAGNCGKLNVSGGSFGKLYIAGAPQDEVVLTGGTFSGVEFKLSIVGTTPCAAILGTGYGFFDGDGDGVKLTDVSSDVAGTVELCTGHDWNSATGACHYCATSCAGHVWGSTTGTCTICGYGHVHDGNWTAGVCSICGYHCEHSWNGTTCETCGFICTDHVWNGATGTCAICGYVHIHKSYDEDGFCTDCGGGQEPTQNSDGYYEINNAGKLYWFAAQVNSGNTTISGKLTADIVVNKNLLERLDFDEDGNVTNGDSFRMWTPIGYFESTQDCVGYHGTFDGANHTISGLYYNGSDRSVGLFGFIGINAHIKNVGVVDNYFCVSNVNGADIGGVVGRAWYSGVTWYAETTVSYDTIIEGCYHAGYIYAGGSWCNVGGVLGQLLNDVDVKNCYNIGSVIGNNSSVGGVIGIIDAGDGPVTVENCYNTGNVGGSGSNLGDIIGYIDVDHGKVNVKNCYHLSTSGNKAYDYKEPVEDEDERATFDNICAKSADEFASGAVAWLLNGETSDGVWKQTLGTDASPNFTGGTVYPVYKCDGSTISDSVYANSAGEKLPHVSTILGVVNTCMGCNRPLIASVTIGETTDYHVTLSEAFAAASGKTATITLLDDTTLTSTIEINDAKSNITLDGTDTWLTGSESEYTVSAKCTMFKITAGTLTVESGTYAASGGQELDVDKLPSLTYITTSSHVFVVTGGTLNVKGGTYSTELGNVIEVSGTATDSTTSSGGGSSGDDGLIYVPDIGTTSATTTAGTVNIEGGSFTSESGYALYVGAVSVKDISVVGKVVQGTANITGGSFSGSSYAVYVDRASDGTIMGDCGKLNAGGGTFGKLYVAGSAKGNVVLSGGTFAGIELAGITPATAPAPSQALKAGYAFYTADAGGEYTVLTAGTDIAGKAVAVKLCTHADADHNCTCDICGEQLKLTFAGYTLILRSRIGVNFYTVLSDEFKNSENAYIDFTVNGRTIKLKVSDARTTTDNEVEYYVFTVPVSAHEMVYQITAEAYMDGEKVASDSESVRDYAMYIINNSGNYEDADVSFAKALLNYGAASQAYFGVKTDDLANKALSADDRQIAQPTVAELDAYKLTGTYSGELGTFTGTSLYLDSATSLRAYFEPAAGVDIGDITFTVTAGSNSKTVTAVETDDGYMLAYDDLMAYELGEEVTFTAKRSSDSTEQTFTCSAMTYAYNVISRDDTEGSEPLYTEELKALVSALYNYMNASKAYGGTNNAE